MIDKILIKRILKIQQSKERNSLKLAEECSELSAVLLGQYLKNKDKSDKVLSELCDVWIQLLQFTSKLSEAEISILNKKIHNKIKYK